MSYTKFAAYTVLRHGGDYSAAAQALAAMGYGDPGTGLHRFDCDARAANDPLRRQHLVQAVESETESDPVSLLLQLLVLFGNVIGRTAHFVVEANAHYFNEFLLLAGPSAKAGKGRPMRMPNGSCARWIRPGRTSRACPPAKA